MKKIKFSLALTIVETITLAVVTNFWLIGILVDLSAMMDENFFILLIGIVIIDCILLASLIVEVLPLVFHDHRID